MKVVQLSTSDSGGAGIAASRIHEGLLSNGIESKFISLHKFRTDIPLAFDFKKKYSNESLNIFERNILSTKRLMWRYGLAELPYEALRKKYLTGRPAGYELFTLPQSIYDLTKLKDVKEADIINLHWVTEGFLDYETFFQKCKNKIVWTLHDMNPFTGGCHHADESTGYLDGCKICPQLNGTVNPKLASEIFNLKERALSGLTDDQLVVVSPSDWLLKRSSASLLFKRFKHVRIPNPVNETTFIPGDKLTARKILNVPADKKVILFIAKDVDNPRKGINYLFQAFQKLKNKNNILICSVGNVTADMMEGIDHMNFGYVQDDLKMATIYSAADVFVLPSLAENLPNTICESLMCGTPVVGFAIGGIPEMINESNGILAEYRNADDLSAAIEKVLFNSGFNKGNISASARREYSSKEVISKYLKVYNNLIA